MSSIKKTEFSLKLSLSAMYSVPFDFLLLKIKYSPDLTLLVEVSKVVSGIFIPMIAAIGSLIAYQQYKITKTKLRFDLYERRFDVYMKFSEFAFKVIDGDEIKSEDYNSLKKSFHFAKFLFKSKVNQHLIVFMIEARKLKKIRAKRSIESSQNMEDEYKLISFFKDETNKLYKLFHPYLKIST